MGQYGPYGQMATKEQKSTKDTPKSSKNEYISISLFSIILSQAIGSFCTIPHCYGSYETRLGAISAKWPNCAKEPLVFFRDGQKSKITPKWVHFFSKCLLFIVSVEFFVIFELSCSPVLQKCDLQLKSM